LWVKMLKKSSLSFGNEAVTGSLIEFLQLCRQHLSAINLADGLLLI